MNSLKFYQASRWCYLHHLTPIAKLIYYFQLLVFHNYIPYTAEIGKTTRIPAKSTGIYIHARAKIGEGCIIAHQVTVGGRSRRYNVPVIGNNVFIGVGAKVMGDVVVGDEVVIGVNAVVLKDVPSNCAVAGVPAKVIKTGIKMRDLV